jgi:hypothetical protein
MNEMPPSVFVVEASTMESFLDGLEERFGGARAWALGAGIPAAQLEALQRLLVEDDVLDTERLERSDDGSR